MMIGRGERTSLHMGHVFRGKLETLRGILVRNARRFCEPVSQRCYHNNGPNLPIDPGGLAGRGKAIPGREGAPSNWGLNRAHLD